MFHVAEIDIKISECTGYVFKTDSIEEIQSRIFPLSSKVRYNIYNNLDNTEYYITTYEDFEEFKGEYGV